MSKRHNSIFEGVDVHFCPDCGTLLPPLTSERYISCLACHHKVDVSSTFANYESSYVVIFNKRENVQTTKLEKARIKQEFESADGPTVERHCPKCGHDKMSYAALQLRSADEGQTVFFTCLKCKYKESENS